MKVPSVQAALQKQALQPMEPMSADEIAKLYAADAEKYAKIIREGGHQAIGLGGEIERGAMIPICPSQSRAARSRHRGIPLDADHQGRRTLRRRLLILYKR
jgi:hypothetical protein